ncbi:MAG: beta strand repeat-containing protein [Candidatus Methylacidiphilales bacterium]
MAGNNTYQDYDIWNPGGLTSTYSLFGTNNGIGHAITGTNVTTNVTAAALKLGPLGWYGGPTQTFTLLTGSPALNTGNPTYANAGSPLNVDQRGRGRDALSFAGPAPDIGAFEAHTNGGAYVVTNTADDGSGGSFRLGFDGTNLAEKPTSITFNIPTTDGGYNTTNPGKWTILNTGGVYQLNNRSLSIDATTQPGYVQGSANPLIVIDGGGTRQIMVSLQSAGDVVSISGLGFYRGKSAAGGAIFANGELHVSESAFYFNNASSGGAIYSTGGGDISVTNSVFYRNIAAGGGGGAINIFSLTKLTVKDSTLLENQTNSSGGAISLGTDGTAIIENSTFSGNTAPDFGGGIYSSAGSSVLNVTNSTFSGNTSNGGSGSAIDTMGTTEIKSSTFSGNSGSAVVGVGGTLSIGSTIIANSGGGVDIYYTGAAYTDLGYNIIENAGFQAPSFNGPGTVTGVDPGLSSLGWYGGPTQTFGLLSGSIALDKIPDTAFVAGTTDQRGVTRGQSLAGNGYADIGAFESRTAYTVTSTADYDPAVVTHMDGTLRLGLAINAAGLDEGLRTINFAIATTDKGYDPLTGQWTITAAPRATPTPNTSAFSITNPVVIDGTTQPVAATPAGPRIVVDGNKLGTVFVIDPGASTDIVSITGLGITNGNGRDYSGGIFIFGGGVVVESGDVSLSQSMIYNNSAAWSGGGVYIDNGAKLTLDTSTVTGNSSLGSGGGIYNVGTLIITNSTLTNNTSQGYGGAIYSSNSLNISDSVIAFNQTTTGSGGGIETRGTAILDNTTLRSNVAGNSGGGLNTTGGRTTVTNSTIVSNAAYGNGGGISISGGTVFELTGTTVASNGAGIHGGGIVIDSGSLTITNSTISSNSALSYGGGVSTGMLPTVTIDNSVLAANIAQSGGGIFNNGVMDITASTLAGNNASGVGGGIYNWRGGLNFDGSVIAGNSSLYGGGIYNDFGTSTAITNSIIKGNTGYSGGGGIFSLYSPLVMTDSTISYNVNYSIAGSGGGLYYVSISPNTATISRSLFEGNHSVGVAGGIYMETDSTLQLTNSTIRANTAYAGGGMYLKGLATILGSTISGNVAASNGGGLSQAGGTLNITTSTFAGNVATAGAGLYLSSGTFTLNSSTISANRATNLTATGGGGLHSRANLQIRNTILAGNIGYDWVMPAGTFIDNGYDLVGSYSLSVPVTLATSTQTIVGLPGLAPLGNYGGPTQTMALMPGSLAIGRAGPTLAGTRDQRGVLRSDGAPDIGAFESRGFVYAITSGNNQSAVFGTVFAQPLVVTIRSLDPGLTNLSGFGNTITLSLPAAGAISTGVLTQNILFNGLTNTAAFNLTAAGTVGTYNVNVTNSTTPLFFTLTNSGIPVTILVDPGQGKTLTKSLLPPPFDTTAFNATQGRNNEPEDYYLYELSGARFTMGYEGKFPLPASLLHINSGDIIPDQAR